MFRVEPADLPDSVKARIRAADLGWRPADRAELSEYVLGFLRLLEEGSLSRTREENLAAFERGWGENLRLLQCAAPGGYEEALRQKYFRDSKFLRYDKDLIISENPQLEYQAFVIARLCLFHSYLRSASVVCELGSGSCGNLLLFSQEFPEAELIGLDWTKASSAIAAELDRTLPSSFTGHRFDMTAPDPAIRLPAGAAIMSIHAFEQLGSDFAPILEYIFAARPSIVLHYEPILEFYDDRNLLDHLAIRYSRKRNYLQGFYTRLHELERAGRCAVLAAFRPDLGGVLHEAAVIVWKPVY